MLAAFAGVPAGAPKTLSKVSTPILELSRRRPASRLSVCVFFRDAAAHAAALHPVSANCERWRRQ